MTPYEAVIIIAINLYIAWRYAVQPIGPDEGNWMLWGWTGAKPYLDFQDCKPIGIHAWMWLLARLTGRRITLSKFIHHAAVGCLITGATFASHSFGLGLLATAWLQSAWLLSYQSWMDAMSGALMLLAFTLTGWATVALLGLALLFNVKAGPMGFVYMAIAGMWIEMGAAAIFGAVVIGAVRLAWPEFFAAMWYGTFTIPDKMRKWRDWRYLTLTQVFQFTLIVPWVGICILTGVPLAAGAAAAVYALFNTWGKVWRPNHFLPLAVVVVARPDPAIAAVLFLAEAIPARLYLGNVWATTYPAIANSLMQARAVGLRLAEEEGDLWVNTYHTEIYVYAGKKPGYGSVEQLEIRDVTPELNRRRDNLLAKMPPKWIVLGPGAVDGHPRGYQQVGGLGEFAILG